MFNVHASSGIEAMKTVMNRIKDIPNKPLVLAVNCTYILLIMIVLKLFIMKI